jgi:hypothetical protein
MSRMFAKNMCDDTFIMTFHQLPGEKKGFSITAEKQPSLQTYPNIFDSGQIPGNMNNLVRPLSPMMLLRISSCSVK